jgi:hypothetical protein
MDINDIDKFQKLMAGMAENFSATLSDVGIDLMYETLKKYSYQQVYEAALKIMKTRKYTGMPTISEFITNIDGTKDDLAEYQYGLILRAIRELGTYGHPRFKDQITQSLVDNRFGWMKICSINPKDMEFFARDFKTAYRSSAEGTSQSAIGYGRSCDLIDMVKKIGNGP